MMILRGLCVAAALAGTAIPARASVYTDDLTKCLVDKATPLDKTELMQWLFTVIAASPDVQAMSRVTDAQRADYTKRAAVLMQRLILVDCHDRTIPALKYDGLPAVQSSFGFFGQVAMKNLMGQEAVAAALNKLDAYIDATRWAKIGEEAGIKAK